LSGKLYFGSVYKIARKISDNEAQFDRLLSHWRAKQAAQTKIDIVKIWKPLSMVFLILFIVISIFGLSYGLRVSPTDFSFQGYAKLTPVAYNYSDVGSIVRITKHTDRAGQEVGNIPYYEIFGRNGKLIFSTVNMSMRNSQKERGVINYFTQKTGISATVQ
ncbi:MAG: hypothetical protein NTY66_01725, partial [Candidatus Vogelbacteria bacterium]|nr:hypothetical protein [Candidatus Vogelbacteria bacterium]